MSAEGLSGGSSVTAVIASEVPPEASGMPGLAVIPTDEALLTAGLRGFGLSDPIEIYTLAEGLMNRNWRVRTREGLWAVKQILDIDASSARRQHNVTRMLADLELPVPPPQRSPGGDTVGELAGIGAFAVLPWVEGIHLDGRDLDIRDCRYLGGLLACIHQGLGSDGIAGVLATAPESQVIAVTEAATAKGKIDYYLGLIASRAVLDEFDHLVRQR